MVYLDFQYIVILKPPEKYGPLDSFATRTLYRTISGRPSLVWWFKDYV